MTKKTRATFLSAMATTFADNVTGDISPQDLRDEITHLADSAAFIDDELEVEANDQTGTSYTLVLADAWRQVRMNNASANTLTVPPNASVAFETGTVVWVEQAGAGTTTVVAGSGVTINTPDDLALVENQTVRLLKVGTDEWTMTDDAVGAAGTAAVNTQTGTSYTLALGDANDIVEMNNASANTLTIPTNAAVAFAVGTIVTVSQIGAGATTVTAASGVTLNGTAAGSATLNAQYDGVSLYKRATDAWIIQGAHGGVT